MKIIQSESLLTFDDVLLLPKFSTVKSRKDVDISTKLGKLKLDLPVISANMKSVTEVDMAVAVGQSGGVGCLHRFWSVKDNYVAAEQVLTKGVKPWISIGINEIERVDIAAEYDLPLVVDVAHGASLQVADFCKKIKDKHPGIFLVVGNFATRESIRDFLKQFSTFHIDAIKVGIGPGSKCETRLKTGIGVPQLSAIMDCVKAGLPVIADGGIKSAGDVVKAIAAGAKAVMVGSLLAGTHETPGPIYHEMGSVTFEPELYPDEELFKEYYGSASARSYEEQGKNSEYITAEGIESVVPYKGPVAKVLSDITGGLRSALSYTGSFNIQEFQERAEFIRITSAGMIESGKKS